MYTSFSSYIEIKNITKGEYKFNYTENLSPHFHVVYGRNADKPKYIEN